MKLTGANVLMDEPDGDIDAHAHVFEKELPLAAERRYTPTSSATLPMLSDNLRTVGLDGALLVQPSFLGCDNSYMIEALEIGKNSDLTFRGVAVVSQDASEQELVDLAKAQVIGVRLNLIKRDQIERFNIEDWSNVLSVANTLGWHVELHCESRDILSILPALLDRCERIVIDHFGRPNQMAPLECPGFKYLVGNKSGQLYVKVSAPYRVFPNSPTSALHSKAAALFSELLSALGPSRLMWGSDWPWTQHEHLGLSYEKTRAWYSSWVNETQDD